MKKRLFFLLTAVVMILFVGGVASADPDEGSAEVLATAAWDIGDFTWGDVKSSDPIIVNGVSQDLKKAFTVTAGEALTIKVRFPEGSANPVCYLYGNGQLVYAETDESYDESGYVTFTVDALPVDFDITISFTRDDSDEYYCVDYRWYPRKCYSVYYKTSEGYEVTLMSPADVGFASDTLTFLGWAEWYENVNLEDTTLYQPGETFQIMEDNSNTSLYAIWSCGVKECTDDYPVWISGVKVTESNKDDVLGDGTVSYDKASSTITFHDADFNEMGFVNTMEGWIASNGIDLAIGGSAVWGGDSAAVHVYGGELKYNGGIFSGYSGSGDIWFYADNGITIEGNGSEELSGLRFYSDGSITIENAVLPNVDINAGGDLTIVNSTVQAMDIYCYNQDESESQVLFKDSVISAESIVMYYASADFIDSDITVDGVWSSEGNLYVRDLNIEGGSVFINGGGFPSRKFSISNGNKKVSYLLKNNRYGIYLYAEEGMFNVGDGVSFRIPEEGLTFFLDQDAPECHEVWIASDSLCRVSVDCTVLELFCPIYEGYPSKDNPCKVYDFMIESGTKFVAPAMEDLCSEYGLERISELTFEGWYADKARTVPFDFDKLITEDVVIYGKWSSDDAWSENDLIDIATAFPDEAFRAYVDANYDLDGDKKLNPSERDRVTEINVRKRKIADLSGIECFPNIELLDCSENQITELDLRENEKLIDLRCRDNKISKLDISECTELRCLDCSNNKLESLDLSNIISLNSLYCSDNLITELDFSTDNVSGWDIYALGLEIGF